MSIREKKQYLRKEISKLKRSYSEKELNSFSFNALNRLEQTNDFIRANCIALYHAIPGEVQTAEFIEKWYQKKVILLPIIEGDNLRLLPYLGKEQVKTGQFGILEPDCKTETCIEYKVELMIVPGIAFDRNLNRMGRGKGYYDRLLSTLSAPKAGLCFHFQLMTEIPTETFDIKMDFIITDKEIIQRDINGLQHPG